MEIPEIFYYNENVAAVAFGILVINIFLFVSLFIDFKNGRKLVFRIFGSEVAIISSIILWKKYGFIFFILVFGVYAFITHPKVWKRIEDFLRFKL